MACPFSKHLHFFAFLFICVLVLVDGKLYRTSCKQTAKFQNPIPDFQLANNVIKTFNVGKPAQCVIECLKEESCQSINYKKVGSSQHVCELNDKTAKEITLTSNSDFLYYEPKTLDCTSGGEPGECLNGGICAERCSTNEIFCSCPLGFVGKNCEDVDPYDLVFPRTSTEDYVLVPNVPESTDTFTLLFWINTLAQTPITPLSYAVGSSFQELLVILHDDKLNITVHSAHTKTFYIPRVNDGFWHHIGLTWNRNTYSVFLDGVLIYSGDGLGNMATFNGGGVFAIGQKMNSLGGSFDVNVAFNGKLCQLNFWPFITVDNIIKERSARCYFKYGENINWNKLRNLANGQVKIKQVSQCKPLRNSSDYDVAMSISSETTSVPTYVTGSDHSSSGFTSLTISFWIKSNSFDSKDILHYSTSSNTAVLSLVITHFVKFKLLGQYGR